MALLAGWWLSQRRWRAASSLLTGGLLACWRSPTPWGALLPSPFWRVLWDVARSPGLSWQRWQGAPLPDDLWWPLLTETAWRVQGFVVGLGRRCQQHEPPAAGCVSPGQSMPGLATGSCGPNGSGHWPLLPVGLALPPTPSLPSARPLFVGGYLAPLPILLAVVHVRAQVQGLGGE
ncbi:MAG: hypothetical protein IPO15_24170 [Anaerolineae bacterium]|uniref:hypothetical protein n=1 Tax=Candidatus Amarolinea dominans TaxID=3140696 RepID=UPI00313765FA|nr:hypothetical protein [Anaerolineae bacterium]